MSPATRMGPPVRQGHGTGSRIIRPWRFPPRRQNGVASKLARTENCTVAFVKAAMKPVRWAGERQGFDAMREQLNEVLAFSGLSVGSDGQMYRRSVATTHDEAAVAKRMRDEMQRRSGHAEVFKYCTKELVAEDCFGAVIEAVKGLAEGIRA